MDGVSPISSCHQPGGGETAVSNRFEAIGSFVYEKGNRIGVTLDEASVDLARKLNAYQMRIERLKAEVEELKNQPDPLTAYLYAAELAKDEVKRLKAEVERLRKAVMHSPASQLKLKELECKTTYEEINPKEGKQP